MFHSGGAEDGSGSCNTDNWFGSYVTSKKYNALFSIVFILTMFNPIIIYFRSGWR